MPYVHDPMENLAVAEDIVADPNAVYGYPPSKDSIRFKDHLEYDWSELQG